MKVLTDKSFITLLAISIFLLIIISTFFILNGYSEEIKSECYWTTKGIICGGKLGERIDE